nr:hypothetical protein [Telmatospirillum sp.]
MAQRVGVVVTGHSDKRWILDMDDGMAANQPAQDPSFFLGGLGRHIVVCQRVGNIVDRDDVRAEEGCLDPIKATPEKIQILFVRHLLPEASDDVREISMDDEDVQMRKCARFNQVGLLDLIDRAVGNARSSRQLGRYVGKPICYRNIAVPQTNLIGDIHLSVWFRCQSVGEHCQMVVGTPMIVIITEREEISTRLCDAKITSF